MISGNKLDSLILVVALLGVALCIALFTRRYPRVGIAVWMLSLCFTPVWLGLNFGPYWPPATLVGILLVFSATKLRVPHLTIWDVGVIAFASIVLVSFAIGAITLPQMFTVMAIWLIPFAAGRVVTGRVDVQWIYDLVAVCFTIVAVLAIIEYLTASNLFVLLRVPGEQYNIWAPLLARGGSLRVEGAFGHPIALGASLALAIPLVIASRFAVWIRTAMVLLMLGAIVLTFSRIGMVSAVLAVLLSVVFVRDGIPRSLRISLVTLSTVLGLAAIPLLADVFTAAGSEASNSALYRGDLTSLISRFDLLGLSSSFAKSVAGATSFGDFRSIDSELILAGLTYGILAVGILLALLVAASLVVLLRRATPPTVAIVAQIPGFASVALITQYSAFVWFIAGLAIATQVVAARSPARKPTASGSNVATRVPAPIGFRSAPFSFARPQLRELASTRPQTSLRGLDNGTS